MAGSECRQRILEEIGRAFTLKPPADSYVEVPSSVLARLEVFEEDMLARGKESKSLEHFHACGYAF